MRYSDPNFGESTLNWADNFCDSTHEGVDDGHFIFSERDMRIKLRWKMCEPKRTFFIPKNNGNGIEDKTNCYYAVF